MVSQLIVKGDADSDESNRALSHEDFCAKKYRLGHKFSSQPHLASRPGIGMQEHRHTLEFASNERTVACKLIYTHGKWRCLTFDKFVFVQTASLSLACTLLRGFTV